jgi:hypothetical protein
MMRNTGQFQIALLGTSGTKPIRTAMERFRTFVSLIGTVKSLGLRRDYAAKPAFAGILVSARMGTGLAE